MSQVRFGSGFDIESVGGLSEAEPARPSAKGGASFADALTHAVGEVDKMQTDADDQSQKIAQGGGNLHETALALEKADVAMRVAVKVRNKLVDAYQDIMRMSI